MPCEAQALWRILLQDGEASSGEDTMTQEEKIRFALVLSEADKIRAMIAEDEAAERSEKGTPQEVPLGIAA